MHGENMKSNYSLLEMMHKTVHNIFYFMALYFIFRSACYHPATRNDP